MLLLNLQVGALCLSDALAELAQRFKDEGMLAYVNLIQKKEKEVGCDVLTHQKWYGCHSIPPCSRPRFLTHRTFCSLGVVQTTSIEFSTRCQLARPARRPLAKTRQNTPSDCEEGILSSGFEALSHSNVYPLPLRTHLPDERLCNSLFVEHTPGDIMQGLDVKHVDYLSR